MEGETGEDRPGLSPLRYEQVRDGANGLEQGASAPPFTGSDSLLHGILFGERLRNNYLLPNCQPRR